MPVPHLPGHWRLWRGNRGESVQIVIVPDALLFAGEKFGVRFVVYLQAFLETRGLVDIFADTFWDR